MRAAAPDPRSLQWGLSHVRRRQLVPYRLQEKKVLVNGPRERSTETSVRFARTSASRHTCSNSLYVVVIQISTVSLLAFPHEAFFFGFFKDQGGEHSPSESLEQSLFPDDPKTWTLISRPGHWSLKSFSNLRTSCRRRSSLSADGNNRS